ncbi:MAG: YbfB/YjiJ family MFS transporter [candidate division NC10 bacterium]|nr:YbfB/YjiJ family MFS transporter [candidate division NC10 bacterium]
MGAIREGSAAIPPRLHYAWVIVGLGHLNVLSALGFARFGYTMILPGMKEGLQLTYAETGWLATGNFVGYLVASLIAGLVASRWPPRGLILIALSCLVIGLGATSLVSGFPSALAARTFTGLASGAVYIPAMALPTLWFAPHRRGLGTGIQTGGSGLGLVLSGLLIPVILRWSGPEGWRHAWLLLAILVGVVWILVLALLRNRPEEIGQLPYGASGAPPPPPAGPARWREVFANPGLWVLGAIYACFGFSYVIYATFFAAYLVKEGGLSPAAAGQLWGLIGVLSIPSGILWGALADRIGKRFGLAIVFGLHAACFATFALARGTTGFLSSAILFGLTAWSIPAIMAAAVGDYARTSLAAAALGFITIIFGVGQAIGPPIAGGLADWTRSFSGAFLLASGVALVGCLGALSLRPASPLVS